MSDSVGEWPLTTAQEHFFRRGRARPDRVMSVFTSYDVRGPLDVRALVRAVHATVERHAAMRVEFTEGPDGLPTHQRVRAAVGAGPLIDLRSVLTRSEEQFENYVERVYGADIVAPWHRTGDRPFRFRLIRNSPDRHALVMVFDHAAIDDRSRMMIGNDLWRLYRGHVDGSGGDLEPPPTYVDAVLRERHHLSDRRRRRNSAYWSRKLDRVPTGAASDTRGAGSIVSITLTGPDFRDWESGCAETGLTSFQRVLGVLASCVLGAAADALVVRMPIDTRLWEYRDVVGMFALSLPLVITEPDPLRIRSELLGTMIHRFTEFDDRLASSSILVQANHIDHDRAPAAADGELGVTVDSGRFHPAIRFAPSGVDVIVHTYRDRLRVVLGMADGVTALAPFNDLRRRFEKALRSTR